MKRLPWILGACAAFVACASFREGADGTAPADAGTSVDAVADANLGTDVVVDGSPANTFCKTLGKPATECVDFEDGIVPASTPWEKIVQASGSSKLTLNNPTSGCGPGESTTCIEVSGSVPSGDYGGAGLRLSIGGAPRNISMSGSFRVESITNGVFDAFSIVMTNALVLWVLEVEIDASGNVVLAEYVLENANPTTADRTLPTPAAVVRKNTWTRLALDLTIGTPSHATLRLDGVIAAEKDVDTTVANVFRSVDFGDIQADQGLTWQVRMDEFTATYAK